MILFSTMFGKYSQGFCERYCIDPPYVTRQCTLLYYFTLSNADATRDTILGLKVGVLENYQNILPEMMTTHANSEERWFCSQLTHIRNSRSDPEECKLSNSVSIISQDFISSSVCIHLQKKSQESINSRLQLVMKSGKYTLGYKSTLKTLRQGKAKLVIISNNTPQLRYAKNLN